MKGMLWDTFNMHCHGLQSFPPEIIAFDDCDIGGNAFTETGRSVLDEELNGEAAKFYKNIEDVNEDEALLWTINDFLAYANLSGWSTKGHYACPCCTAQTCSKWLYNGKKFSYMGHHQCYGKMNQPPNMQTKRRLRETYVDWQIDDESDKEDDPNEADLWKKRINMRIRRDLHPQLLPNRKSQLPPSIFAMSKKEKEVFCTVL
ncbi:hypothetical protein J1N35_025444, partial [Gossypium stocksii]